MLHEADEIIGHNVVRFDVQAIKKVFPWFAPKKVTDTLVLVRIIAPDIKQSDYVRARNGKPIDQSPPRADPIPEGRAQAETRITKPDDAKALATQYGVDPSTGAFSEEAEITQLATEGRLTENDAAALADAQATYEDGAAYGEALKAAVACLI